MENNKIHLESIKCPLHPNEIVQRLDINPASSKTLYCIECLLEVDLNTKNNLKGIDSLLEYLYEGFLRCPKVTPITKRSNNTSEMIDKEKIIEQLKTNIEKQKNRVVQVLDDMKKKFEEIFEATKLNLFHKLDLKYEIFQKNFEVYEETFKTYYDPNHRSTERDYSESTLAAKINSCKTSSRLEAEIKALLLEMHRSSQMKFSGPELEITMMQNYMKRFSENLSEINLCNETILRPIISDTTRALKSSLLVLSELNPEIRHLKSTIVSEYLDNDLFKFITETINKETKFLPILILKTNDKNSISLMDLYIEFLRHPYVLLVAHLKSGQTIAMYREGCIDFSTESSFGFKMKFENGLLFNVNKKEVVSKQCSMNSAKIISIANFMNDFAITDKWQCFYNFEKESALSKEKNTGEILGLEMFTLDFNGTKKYSIQDRTSFEVMKKEEKKDGLFGGFKIPSNFGNIKVGQGW